MALNNVMGLQLLGTSVSPFLYIGTIIPFDKHSGNVVKLNKLLKIQVIIHKILLLQYNRHSFNIIMHFNKCTYSMLETVNYYNLNKSNVFVLMLDASKSFDRVNYCKRFGELLKRDISPIVLKLLLYMYTSQTLRVVKWGHTVSNYFTVRNGVKQGGVLSPLLFAIYTDSLLKRLEESGVGCHMGGHFTGALAYADDITLISPSMSGLRTLTKVCEEYATGFEVTFNGKMSVVVFQG